MADKTQGHREPDEDQGPFSRGRRATPDEFDEVSLQSGLGELFVSEQELAFEDFDELEGEETLLEDFDEQDLEAFFDPEDGVEGLDDLRAELLDDELLDAGSQPRAMASRHEIDADFVPREDERDAPGSDPAHAPQAARADALGSLFSELGEVREQADDGNDAWALDQVVEEGMSWLMELGDGERGADGSAATDADSGGTDGDWSSAGLGRPGRRRRRGLITLVLLALLAAGGTYGYREFFPTEGEEQVAVRPPRPARPAPPIEIEGGSAPEVEAAALATESGDGEAALEGPTEGELAASEAPVDPNDPSVGPRPFAGTWADLREPFRALSQAGDALAPPTDLPFLVAHFTLTAGLPAPPDEAGPALPAEGATSEPLEIVASSADPNAERASRAQLLGLSDLVVLPEANMPFRMASAADLRGVWPGATIPVDLIDASERIMTPSVGRVRVVLHGGEVFDGNLYAVGEKKVWLELGGGRMALLSWQVVKIEHLSTDSDTPGFGTTGSQNLAGLERVRARTPGGVFYGKLLNQDGRRVTLITSEGARITLEDADVEPAGRSLTRIIDASAVDPEDAPEPD